MAGLPESILKRSVKPMDVSYACSVLSSVCFYSA